MGEIKKSRKKYDSEDSKRRLLRAALDIFAKEGYEAATTRAIAKKAGVSDALIQRYFEGKLGLLLALSLQFKSNMADVFANKSQESLEAELDAFFRGRIEFAKKNKKFVKILITQAIVNPDFRQQMVRVSNETAPQLLKNLHALQEAQKITGDVDLNQLVNMIDSICIGLSFVTQVIELRADNYVDEFIPLIVKLICGPMRNSTKPSQAA